HLGVHRILLPVQLVALEHAVGVEDAEPDPHHPHGGDLESEQDHGQLQEEAEPVGPGPAAQHPGARQQREQGEQAPDPGDGAVAGHELVSGQDGEEHHERLDDEDGGGEHPLRAVRAGRGREVQIHDHSSSGTPSSSRTSPVRVTDPATTTPPNWSPSVSARSTAAWIASGRLARSTTLSSSWKMSRAMSARTSVGIARGELDWVMTTLSSSGSRTSRISAASFSRRIPTRPTVRVKRKFSRTVSTRVRAPAGLCAASSRIVGAWRTTSARPGEVTLERAALSSSPPSGVRPSPSSASAAATASRALRAWCSPSSERNTSS